MVWFKLDDGFFDHPKVVQAGRDARDLWLAAGCYSANKLTDGFIAYEVLPLLAIKAGVRNPRALADRLVASRAQSVHGLFEPREGGYAIHDYLDFNPSRATVLAERDKTRQKVADWRAAKKGGNPAGNPVTDLVSNPGSNPVGNGAPVPVPRPGPHEAATQSEDLHREATARATETAVERARAFGVPKPGAMSPQERALSRALAAALEQAEPATPSEERGWILPIREMVRATPPVVQGEIPRLVTVYRELYTTPCTPQAIVNRLSQLRADQPAPKARPNGKAPQTDPMAQSRRLALSAAGATDTPRRALA